MIKNVVKGYGLRFLFSFGSNQAKKLIHRCKEEYNYDMVTMIRSREAEKQMADPCPYASSTGTYAKTNNE